MANEIFVDAGAWIAISDARDEHHTKAVELHRRLLQERRALVTTNLVIAEAYTVIRHAGGHQPALRFLAALRQSSRLVRIYSDAALEAQAEEILRRFADQDFSFSDAVSFSAMRQRGIAEAFAFDRHFSVAGFALLPLPDVIRSPMRSA